MKILWDSCVLISLFEQDDPERTIVLGEYLTRLQRKEVTIVVSALVFTEVRNDDQPEKLKNLRALENFQMVSMDVRLCDKAYTIRRRHSLSTPDAMHLATALVCEVDELHTYDKRLLGLNGQFGKLKINEPTNGQNLLFSP